MLAVKTISIVQNFQVAEIYRFTMVQDIEVGGREGVIRSRGEAPRLTIFNCETQHSYCLGRGVTQGDGSTL